ncbi:Uncharacterised protein [Vibrio cholerae]|nr:Uncharacterised protein [Vibrio cholerae]
MTTSPLMMRRISVRCTVLRVTRLWCRISLALKKNWLNWMTVRKISTSSKAMWMRLMTAHSMLKSWKARCAFSLTSVKCATRAFQPFHCLAVRRVSSV